MPERDRMNERERMNERMGSNGNSNSNYRSDNMPAVREMGGMPDTYRDDYRDSSCHKDKKRSCRNPRRNKSHQGSIFL